MKIICFNPSSSRSLSYYKIPSEDEQVLFDKDLMMEFTSRTSNVCLAKYSWITNILSALDQLDYKNLVALVTLEVSVPDKKFEIESPGKREFISVGIFRKTKEGLLSAVVPFHRRESYQGDKPLSSMVYNLNNSIVNFKSDLYKEISELKTALESKQNDYESIS